MPTEEEWNEWLHHPCTNRLRLWADKSREELKDEWAEGHFSAAFDMEMAVKNAGATGACSIYKEIVTLDYQQIVIGAADEEQVRTDPVGAGSTS